MGGFFSGGTYNVDPYSGGYLGGQEYSRPDGTKGTAPAAGDILSQLMGWAGQQGPMPGTGPNQMQQMASKILMGGDGGDGGAVGQGPSNPFFGGGMGVLKSGTGGPQPAGQAGTTASPGQSFTQGGVGNLGAAGGAFNTAIGNLSADSPTNSALNSMLDSSFLDVANDPYMQQVMGTNQQAAQSMLNQNLDRIGASSQLSSGGVGTGSGKSTQQAQAVGQTASGLAAQNAQMLASEHARRSGQQLGAVQAGQQGAGMLGNLASGLGQLGLGQGGLGLQYASGLADLGGQMFNQQMMPMNTMFQIAQMLKSIGGGSTPSPFSTITQGIGQLGSAAGSLV